MSSVRAVGVFAGVGHAWVVLECVFVISCDSGIRTHETLLAVLELEVLVGELGPIYALPASAVALGEITTLDHKLLDHAVEGGALVAKALLAGSESTEVVGGLSRKALLAGAAWESMMQYCTVPLV
jgi:hypothetical protein